MDDETAAALEGINRRFYEDWAERFSDTRSAPWRGWQRLLDRLPDDLAGREGLRVLDVGCGNGRLALFLAGTRGETAFSYLGVDASLSLLGLARRRLPPSFYLVQADVTASTALDLVRPASVSLVAAFGLIHHVPGFDRRRALVAAMAAALRPGGMLWLSFWQFARDPRLEQRTVTWEEHNRRAARVIDPARLEEGDLLLRWGEADAGAVRYCHFTDRAEAHRLVRGLDLELADSLDDDGPGGNLNLYLALRRAPR